MDINLKNNFRYVNGNYYILGNKISRVYVEVIAGVQNIYYIPIIYDNTNSLKRVSVNFNIFIKTNLSNKK
jgi:hypothetical protein